MKIDLNRLHYPVTVLGPGRRIGLWVQGCSIGCPGCLSRDTWAISQDARIEVEEVVQWCRDHKAVDGVTISGGEPFQQPEALLELLVQLDAWRCEYAPWMDFLCYSGLPWAKLRRDFPEILARLDALIPEPFVESLPTDAAWRGSANQTLIPLSALGRQKYAAVDAPVDGDRLQVSAAEGQIWLIGIPGRGALDRTLAAAEQRGISVETTSWNA